MTTTLHIELSLEQSMLQDAAARYLERSYSFQERQRILASGTELDTDKWRDYADMGWLGLPLPEGEGGTGGDALDLFLLSQAFGKALVVEPFLATVVLGGMTVATAGTAAQRARILPGLIAGQTLLAFACAEPQGGYDLFDVETQAQRDGDGFVVSGFKSVVLGAASAHFLIVSARTAGSRQDRQGVSLFLVDRSAPGVTLRPYGTIDGRRAAEVKLDGVRLGMDDVLGELHGAAGHIERARTLGTVALLGEAVGCLEGALACTIEYLKNRQQFGQPLSRFQALRHRVADRKMHLELARSMSFYATLKLNAPTDERRSAMARAKYQLGVSMRFVGQQAVQLHGGIGVTDEYIVSHYFKKLTQLEITWGDTLHQLGEVSERMQDTAGVFA